MIYSCQSGITSKRKVGCERSSHAIDALHFVVRIPTVHIVRSTCMASFRCNENFYSLKTVWLTFAHQFLPNGPKNILFYIINFLIKIFYGLLTLKNFNFFPIRR